MRYFTRFHYFLASLGILSILFLPGHINGWATGSTSENLEDFEQRIEIPKASETLSLEEAIRIAILQSLNIKIINLEQQISSQEIPKAESIYDTEASVAFSYDHDSEQQASSIAGSRVITGNFDYALQKKLPVGPTVELSMGHERESTNAFFSTLNPSYRSTGKLALTLPILRNAFGLLDRSEVHLVKIDVEQFDQETQDRIEEAVASVTREYWNLVLKLKTLKARIEAFEQAKAFWRTTMENFSFGLTEKPDYTQLKQT